MQQNLIDELDKFGVETSYQTLGRDMCDLFLELIEKREVKDENIQVKQMGKVTTECSRDFCDEVVDEARRFCIDHKDEIHLLPLCQIAMYIGPMDEHFRRIYADYIYLDKAVREAVMKINNISLLSFKEHWEYRCVELFEEDIEKLELANVKFLYDGGKYFHKIKNYSNFVPKEMDPKFFPKATKKGIKYDDSLMGFIDNYLYYKKIKSRKRIARIVPMDYLWNKVGMGQCPECEMVFWTNLFIYSASLVIIREYGRKEPMDIEFLAPALYELETLEDLYYATLMTLYNIYC